MIKDKHISRAANIARECVELVLGTTATSQTGKLPDSLVPGFAFEIVRIEVNALTVTAAITVDIQIGPVAGTLATALASVITPVAATPTVGTLSTALAAKRGAATDSIAVLYTTDGSGAATNARVRVWIRPIPLNGEVYFV